jgi:hypothetical protein
MNLLALEKNGYPEIRHFDKASILLNYRLSLTFREIFGIGRPPVVSFSRLVANLVLHVLPFS